MLIDWTYFTKGSRHILNNAVGTIPNAQATAVLETVNAFIDEYQEEFLVRMLGEVIGNKVHTYLICLDEDGGTSHTETFDSLCDFLRESFADYVFYHFLGTTNTQSTVTGIVRMKNANTPVSPLRRQVRAWNSMVNRNRIFAEWSKSSECKVSGIKVSESMLTKINSLNL